MCALCVGGVSEIEKADWVREVNDVSREAWVVVHLYQDYVVESSQLAEAMRQLAPKHRRVRFVSIKATSAVENWPDHKLPALFLYRHGEMQHQLIGNASEYYGAPHITADTLEKRLAAHEVLQSPDLEDWALPTAAQRPHHVRRGALDDDDDATWDA